MADREERQFMRQRGAGARDVDEFSLSLGGLSSSRAASPDDASIAGGPVLVPLANENEQRQQRFLMRQRGAGSRDVDFSVNLGIPPASSPTSRTSLAGSTTGSNPQTRPVLQNGADADEQDITIVSTRIGRGSGVSRDGPLTEEDTLDHQPDDQNAMFIDDDEALGDLQGDDATASIERDSTNASVDGSAGSTTSSKRRRKKKSVLIKSKRRKITSTGSVATRNNLDDGEEAEEEHSLLTASNTSQVAKQKESQPSKTGESSSRAQGTSSQTSQPNEGSEKQTSGSLMQPTKTVEPGPRAVPSGAYSIFNKASRPAVPAIPRIQREHGVSQSDNRPINVAYRPQAKPRTNATPKTKSRKGKGSKVGKSDKGEEKRNNILVRVHRLAHASQLEFITEEEDEYAIAQHSAFPTRRTMNSIDILAQICQEIVQERVKVLNEQPVTDSSRSNGTNKKIRVEAIRAFGEELDGRLVMMATALDHNLTLSRNLKAAIATKAIHRETLLEIRKQREDIEIQQDAVRAANESASKDASERFELNSLLSDIQLAVQRGREGEGEDENGDEDNEADFDDDDQRQGLAMRLQRIGEVVSSAGGRVGLLQKVKGLNGLLERLVESGGGLS